ncbi:hypothetical protein HAHI6034_06740 [Hathewaya histolytica]|uniref:2'-5' RNA ligase n=1 Tax=Hathewaya histolytica TaxID=1498 RepID=A0A4V6KFH8_HATHI|nr:hypothetical protein [Hathewaya histolytica]VTQ96197.1 2'-5' RNA ligase [Hathewaya histolytica]
MKYQLVALFDDESHNKIEGIQRQICKKFKLYRSNPSIYIPLSVVSNPDMEKLDHVITKILAPYKKYKVNIMNGLYVNPETKQVNLVIDEKGYMSRIWRNIIDNLDLYGFKLSHISFENLNINLQIPLANANYNIKKIANQSVIPVKRELSAEEHLNFGKIDRIELWKVSNNKRDILVKSFELKNF